LRNRGEWRGTWDEARAKSSSWGAIDDDRESLFDVELYPIYTGRRAVVHGRFNLRFRCPAGVVNHSFLMNMAVITVFHTEDLRAKLSTGFAADAAVAVNCRYA
jgi:hypothetical protein